MTPHLEALLDEVNRQVENYEERQFLAVVSDDWQTANDFLTPTLKIKRNVIEERYEPCLDDWYTSRQRVVWQTSAVPEILPN